MIIQKRCSVCQKTVAIRLTAEQYMMWKSGVPLEDISTLTPDDISLLNNNRCITCKEDQISESI